MKQQLIKLLKLTQKIFKWAKFHKKISLPLVISLIILIIIFKPKNAVIIATQPAMQSDLIKSISITGTIESQNSVNLTFQSGGTINYIGANEGDTVYRGQAIVSLDKQKLEATFRQAEQDFTAAKAASEQYYSSHTNATESYDEKVKRTSLDAIQNKAYDQMKRAEKDLTDSVLYSPIDGILTKAGLKNVGVNITATTAFTITDSNSLDFKMDIDEADIGSVKTGQNVNIILDAYPNETLKVKIDSIDFVTHTTSTGGDAYTIKGNLTTDNKDYKYRVGMNGNAEIILDRRKDVVYISLSSVFDNNKAYVKKGNKFELRTVKVGLENDTDVEVLSGVEKNEEVVLDPTLVKPQKGFRIPFLAK
nr:efflux RND transporter periplasmic adaptor subunit [Candidatus Levybacteria bacterium]